MIFRAYSCILSWLCLAFSKLSNLRYLIMKDISLFSSFIIFFLAYCLSSLSAFITSIREFDRVFISLLLLILCTYCFYFVFFTETSAYFNNFLSTTASIRYALILLSNPSFKFTRYCFSNIFRFPCNFRSRSETSMWCEFWLGEDK